VRPNRYGDLSPVGLTKSSSAAHWDSFQRPLTPPGLCRNEEEARKDAHDREAIVTSLREALRRGEKSLVGNKGYRRYLRAEGKAFSVDEKRIEEEARYDGTWVLRTNTAIPTKPWRTGSQPRESTKSGRGSLPISTGSPMSMSRRTGSNSGFDPRPSVAPARCSKPPASPYLRP
jgi:hypothetical protein